MTGHASSSEQRDWSKLVSDQVRRPFPQKNEIREAVVAHVGFLDKSAKRVLAPLLVLELVREQVGSDNEPAVDILTSTIVDTLAEAQIALSRAGRGVSARARRLLGVNRINKRRSVGRLSRGEASMLGIMREGSDVVAVKEVASTIEADSSERVIVIGGDEQQELVFGGGVPERQSADGGRQGHGHTVRDG